MYNFHMNIQKIRVFHPTITNCELRLQYSSRETEPFWLEAQLYLYAGKERRKILFLGGGSKNDSEEAIRLLKAQGFARTSSRLNQEWYHISFEREPPDNKSIEDNRSTDATDLDLA